MSADNWSLCPKCKEIENKKYEKDIKDLENVYGKIPLEDFKSKQKSLILKGIKTSNDHNLREDYEFCLEENILKLSYRARCTECGFTFKYIKEINILTGDGMNDK